MPFYPGDEEYEKFLKKRKAKQGKKKLRNKKIKAKMRTTKGKLLSKKQKAMKAIYGRTK